MDSECQIHSNLSGVRTSGPAYFNLGCETPSLLLSLTLLDLSTFQHTSSTTLLLSRMAQSSFVWNKKRKEITEDLVDTKWLQDSLVEEFAEARKAWDGPFPSKTFTIPSQDSLNSLKVYMSNDIILFFPRKMVKLQMT